MLSFFNLNISLFSALEQFEIIAFTTPGLEGAIIRTFWFFLPQNTTNNLSFSLFIIFFYLINSLKGFSIYNNNYVINNSSTVVTKETILPKFNGFEIPWILVFIIIFSTNFVMYQILDNLSYKKSIFINYALSLFVFLLVCNLIGMIPYSLTATSYIALTLNLSGMSFFGNLLLGLRVHQWKFFKFFIPGGVSGFLLIFMVIIELISYITRLFSMAIRLFANMLSGHALIKILSGLVFLTFSDIVFVGLLTFIVNLIVLAVTVLEVIVAFLQSYVFVVLSIVYTNESILLH